LGFKEKGGLKVAVSVMGGSIVGGIWTLQGSVQETVGGKLGIGKKKARRGWALKSSRPARSRNAGQRQMKRCWRMRGTYRRCGRKKSNETAEPKP